MKSYVMKPVILLLLKYILLLYGVIVAEEAAGQHILHFEIPSCPYVGIEESIQPSAFIHVFPQPAANELTIEIDDPGFAGANYVELSLYNMIGRLITRETVPQGANKIQLDVSAFQSGVYLLQIRMDQRRYNKRIIVAKE